MERFSPGSVRRMSGSGRKVSIPSFFLAGVSATVRLLREQFLSTRAARPASEDESQGQAKAATPSRPPRACKGKAKLGKEARPDTRERLGKPGLSLFGRGQRSASHRAAQQSALKSGKHLARAARHCRITMRVLLSPSLRTRLNSTAACSGSSRTQPADAGRPRRAV